MPQPRPAGQKGKSGRAPVPTRSELDDILRACNTFPHAVRNRLTVMIFFGLGLRPVEASRLLLKDVYDFENDRIYDELILLAAYTKFGKVRQVPIADRLLVQALRDYVELRRAGKRRHFQPGSPLILSQKGGPFSANSIGNLMNEILEKRAKFRRGSAYSGRRFFATTMKRNGVSLRTIQALMGHESLVTTQKYLDDDPDEQRRAVLGIL